MTFPSPHPRSFRPDWLQLETRINPADLYVGTLGAYTITSDQGVIGTLDAGDIVTWKSGTGVTVTGLTFGTQAFTDLASAIAGASKGDTLKVAAGVYDVTTTIVIDQSVTILGPQAGVDPRTAAGLRTPGSTTEAIFDGGLTVKTILRIAADNVTLDGLEVRLGTGDLVESNTVVANPTIRYCIVHDSLTDEAIQIRKATNAVIEYNLVYHNDLIPNLLDFPSSSGGDGIAMNDSMGGTIRGNEIRNVTSQNGSIYLYNLTGGPIIEDNLIVNDGSEVSAIVVGDRSGGNLTAFMNAQLVGNTIQGARQGGISILTNDVSVFHNMISGVVGPFGAINVIHNGTPNIVNVAAFNPTLQGITAANNVLMGNTYGFVNWAVVSGSDIKLNFNNIQSNVYGLFNKRTEADQLNARDNWWGDDSGPNYEGNGGKGQIVLDNFGSGQNVDVGLTVTLAQVKDEVTTRLTAASVGTGLATTITVFNPNGSNRFLLQPGDAFLTKGATVATGDLDGDLIEDIVVAARSGGKSVIRVYSGATGERLATFQAFPAKFKGGAFVAVGDVDASRPGNEIVVGGGTGKQVRVFSFADVLGSATPTPALTFNAYGGQYKGGVRIALGDLNNDGFREIITAKASGKQVVRAFDLNATPGKATPVLTFSADAKASKVGGFITAGDVTGDGVADIFVSLRLGNETIVRGFDGTNGTALAGSLAQFTPFAGFKGEVRLTGLGSSNKIETLVLGMGAAPAGAQVVAFNLPDVTNPVFGPTAFFGTDLTTISGIYIG